MPNLHMGAIFFNGQEYKYFRESDNSHIEEMGEYPVGFDNILVLYNNKHENRKAVARLLVTVERSQ